MKKHIIILAILAIAILVLPFLIGDKITLLAEKPIETVAPAISPEPTIETDIVEIIIPLETNTPIPAPTPEIVQPTDEPIIPEVTSVPVSQQTHSPQQTHAPGVSVPHGAAFVLTIHGKNITIAPSVDEATLEKTPGWLNTSASPGDEGVCVVYGRDLWRSHHRHHAEWLRLHLCDRIHGDPRKRRGYTHTHYNRATHYAYYLLSFLLYRTCAKEVCSFSKSNLSLPHRLKRAYRSRDRYAPFLSFHHKII